MFSSPRSIHRSQLAVILLFVATAVGCVPEEDVKKRVSEAERTGRLRGQLDAQSAIDAARRDALQTQAAAAQQVQAAQARADEMIAAARSQSEASKQEIVDALNRQVDDLRCERDQQQKRAAIALLTQPALLLAVAMTFGGAILALLLWQRRRLQLAFDSEEDLRRRVDYDRLRLLMRQIGISGGKIDLVLAHSPDPV